MKKYYQFISEIILILENERRKLPGLIITFILVSLIELISIGLIAPFVALVVDFDSSKNTPFIMWLNNIGITTEYPDLIIILCCLLIIIFILKGIAVILMRRAIFRFVWHQITRIRTRLMEIYQQMPYGRYIERNSSEYIQAMQVYTQQYIISLKIIILITSEIIMAIAILILLAYTNFLILMFLLFLLVIVTLVYDGYFKQRIQKAGKLANQHNNKVIQSFHEGMEGFKEIRILKGEKYFRDKIHYNSKKYATYQQYAQVVSIIPRYALETILIIFIVGIVITTILLDQEVQKVIPLLSMFGIAALRLIPVTNTVVSGISSLRFQRHGVSMLFNEINQDASLNTLEQTSIVSHSPQKESFRELELSQVKFKYSDKDDWTISGMSAIIKKGDSIGLIGPSGSGKTTLIDIILGLLEPQEGAVYINNKPLKENLSNWYTTVAYLPQQIFIIDDSVRRNVALTVIDSEIDDKQVIEALRQARLLDLIEQMPQGLDTTIGERGMRISGGQRQRIALARAFYHNREVLIMDEATSSLDEETERQIVSEIKHLKGHKTLIIIAHSLSTVKHCDRLYRLEHGTIVEECTPNNILSNQHAINKK